LASVNLISIVAVASARQPRPLEQVLRALREVYGKERTQNPVPIETQPGAALTTARPLQVATFVKVKQTVILACRHRQGGDTITARCRLHACWSAWDEKASSATRRTCAPGMPRDGRCDGETVDARGCQGLSASVQGMPWQGKDRRPRPPTEAASVNAECPRGNNSRRDNY
jgi:hypothetical protein